MASNCIRELADHDELICFKGLFCTLMAMWDVSSRGKKLSRSRRKESVTISKPLTAFSQVPVSPGRQTLPIMQFKPGMSTWESSKLDTEHSRLSTRPHRPPCFIMDHCTISLGGISVAFEQRWLLKWPLSRLYCIIKPVYNRYSNEPDFMLCVIYN